MLEKTFESPLDLKEIKPVHPIGHQSWVFIGRTDAEAETPILWSPDANRWLIWKDPDAGKDWRREKGLREDEMVGWHHRLHGDEFGWSPGVGDGQKCLVCCSPWGHKGWTRLSYWTEQHRFFSCCSQKWPQGSSIAFWIFFFNLVIFKFSIEVNFWCVYFRWTGAWLNYT